MYISDKLQQPNCFDDLRLLAALLVLISHSFDLVGVKEPIAPVLTVGTGGYIGVATFFVISGFLVTKSIESRPVSDYLYSRALRILPGLAGVTLFDVLLIGALCTTLPLTEYLTSSATHRYLANIFVFTIQPSLPGVFETLRNGGVNGSLWTLPLEVACYFVLVCVCFVGVNKRLIVGLYIALFALFMGISAAGLSYNFQGGTVFNNVPFFSFVDCAVYFFGGSALWVLRGQVKMDGWLSLVMLFVTFLATYGAFANFVFHFTYPYLVVFVALNYKSFLPGLKLLGDVSYGTYLYAFPTQQAAIYLTGTSSPLLLTALVMPVVLVLASLSWNFVEKPVLRLRPSLNKPRAPTAQVLTR